jgi:predicted N-acetyltransferase YhbS
MRESGTCDAGLALCRGGPRDGVRELLDRHFDGLPGLVEEFPLLLAAANASRSWVFEAHGDCVAHAAWRPLELACGSERLRAAGIGLVTTHGEWRGRGLATALVAHCTAQAYREGAVLALLFAPERSLYTRLGFAPAGRERLIELKRRPAQPSAGGARGRPRPANPSDASALRDLLRTHPWRVERTAAEFAALLAIPGTRTYVLDQGGAPTAYCCSGKGRDLQGVIHEWAGDPDALAELIAAIAEEDPETRWLLAPAAATPPTEGTEALQTIGLARVLRPAAVGTEDPGELIGAAERAGRLEAYVWGLDSF